MQISSSVLAAWFLPPLLALTPIDALGAELVTAAQAQLAPQSGAGHSLGVSLSHDGSVVAFTSSAQNLTAHPYVSPFANVFATTPAGNPVRLVSVSTNGTGANGHCLLHQVSPDGRWVLFESTASNLVTNDFNRASDVFRRDLLQQKTELVSVDRFGSMSGNGSSDNATLSVNGRFVIFTTTAANLVPGTFTLSRRFIVRDLELKTNRVAIPDSSLYTAADWKPSPSLSADGQRLAFTATRVQSPGRQQVYVRNLQTGELIWASTNAAQLAATFGTTVERVHSPLLSENGSSVWFSVECANRSVAFLARHDLAAQTSRIVSTNSMGLALTPDGRLGLFQRNRELWRWDASSQTATLVLASFYTNMLASSSVALSADGQIVAALSVDEISQVSLVLRDMARAQTTALTAPDPSLGLLFTEPAMDRAGQTVAFESRSDDLALGDSNAASDVFLWQADASALVLLSQRDPALPSATPSTRSAFTAGALSGNGTQAAILASPELAGLSAGLPQAILHHVAAQTNLLLSASATGEPAHRDVLEAALSQDGSTAVFVTAATNLVANDQNDRLDVFARNLQTGQIDLVSARPGGASANSSSWRARLSADGQLVAFQSTSTDLTISPDSNGKLDVFLRDRSTGTTTLLSRRALSNSAGSSASSDPEISPDGQFVLFRSDAPDLVDPPATGANHLYLWSRATGALTDIRPGTNSFRVASYSFSNNSRAAVYSGMFPGTNQVYLLELPDLTQTLVCSECYDPSLSANGSRVAVMKTVRLSDGAYRLPVAVFDPRTGEQTVFDTGIHGAPPNQPSVRPQLSADGSLVVFTSKASNLAVRDDNQLSDLFLGHVASGRILPLSLVPGTARTGQSQTAQAALASDGRTLLVQSYAENFAAHDFNRTADLFLIRLGLGDSDFDTLDDAWEVTFFGNLQQDGSLDSDGDGLTDRAEFRAGTSPLAGASVLTVIQITRLAGGPRSFVWSSVPGKQYQLQFKDNVTSPNWTTLAQVFSATSDTTAADDTTVSTGFSRFYRVILVE